MTQPKPKSAAPFVRNAAVLEPVKTREATSPRPRRALGLGVCSGCRETWPLFEVGKRALCRGCAGADE